MRRTVTLALAAAVLIGGGFLLRSVAALAETVQVWRGYYTLVVAGDAAEPVRRLREAAIGPVIAASSATARLTTFRGFESVAVADLGQRLDPLDPRYDPYLRRVGTWFADPSGMRDVSFVYVGSAVAPGFFATRVARVLAGTGARWYVAGLPWHELLPAILLAVAGMALQIVPRDGRTPCWWRTVLAAPWLFLVAHGGLPAALVAVPAHAAVVRLAGAATMRRAGWRARPAWPAWRWPAHGALFGGALVVAVAAVAAGTAAVPVIERLGPYVVIGATWCAALAACARVAPRRSRPRRAGAGAICAVGSEGGFSRAQEDRSACGQPEERPAAPAPGAGVGWSAARRPLAVRVAGSLTLVVITAAMLAGGGRGVPRPDPPPEHLPVTLRAMARFGTTGAPLPVLTDFVTHVAYQETVRFGRPYRLPAPGERVLLDHYRRETGGRVVREEREVARFDEHWLRAVVADVAPVSIAAMLLAQGRLMAARYGPAQRSSSELALWISLTLSLAVRMLASGFARRDAVARSAHEHLPSP